MQKKEGVYIIENPALIKKIFERLKASKDAYYRTVMLIEDISTIIQRITEFKRSNQKDGDFAVHCHEFAVSLNRFVADKKIKFIPATPERVKKHLQQTGEFNERDHLMLLSLALVSTWFMFKPRV